MKQIIGALFATAAISQAAVIPFGISPAGTDVAVGLSPSNEVPAVVNSTGSGGAISGGVLFDTDTGLLTLTLGYGSAAGFTDLTGPATGMTLNGPADTNQSGPVLFDLGGLSFPASTPAQGGVIFGSLSIPTNDVPDLLAGMDYIDIATANNPGGELRGQLVPLPPTLTCPDPVTVECGTPAVLSAQVESLAGNAMTVVWSVNGTPLQTNQVPSLSPPVATNVVLSADLPLGTNLVQVAVTDSANLSASCETMVTVVDTIPPVIAKASAWPNTLWPPNHKMVRVGLRALVTDACGPTTWKILSVTSNEPVNGRGDGNTSPDWVILSDHAVDLRAERAGPGSGRVYTITIQATDAAGNVSTPQTVTVRVPKSMGRAR